MYVQQCARRSPCSSVPNDEHGEQLARKALLQNFVPGRGAYHGVQKVARVQQVRYILHPQTASACKTSKHDRPGADRAATPAQEG